MLNSYHQKVVSFIAMLESDALPLHADPGKHSLESRIFIDPISSAAVRLSEVGDNVLVCDARQLLNPVSNRLKGFPCLVYMWW